MSSATGADRVHFMCGFSSDRGPETDSRRVSMSVSPDTRGGLILKAYDGLVTMDAPLDDWKKAIAWAESAEAERVWRPRVESAIVGQHRVVIELKGLGINEPSRVVGDIDKATSEAVVVLGEDGEISVLGWAYIDDISTATRMGVVATDLVVGDALRAVARGLDDLAEAA